ncbi:MAG TPA: hypothetical protein VHT27_07705 [Solirubrobacteraceae bacterium]|jgi:hypothetical protein|nr:hypothetical protein [Solirubrobacteraceae bacterium]
MQSVRLHGALTEFLQGAAAMLHADVLAGNEVPFEVASSARGRRGAGPSLYCYRPLTGAYIDDHQPALQRLASHEQAERELVAFAGLDRYLIAAGVEPGRAGRSARARMALRALLADACGEQSDFELPPERIAAAIARLEAAAEADAGGVTLVATLHGLATASEQVQLTAGLTIARPELLQGLPEALRALDDDLESDGSGQRLVAVLTARELEPAAAIDHGVAVMRELLRALRLFGEGRVTLGALAWTRVGDGAWTPLPLGTGGRPGGVLLIAPEQEDELRAFCNLISRRAPVDTELAWALRRFELGCDREDPREAISDHLLALRALLEPEGPASGMMPGRLAALCATPQRRMELTEHGIAAIALERAAIEGEAAAGTSTVVLANEIADHLRALLRDVICGHLEPDLVSLADEILLEGAAPAAAAAPVLPSAQQVLGDAGEAEEILDLFV